MGLPCSTSARVRVATLNVWGTRGEWAERRGVLTDGFAHLAPDLLTLQETILTDSYDQARDLLGDDYHLVHQADREVDGQGLRPPAGGRWAGRSTWISM